MVSPIRTVYSEVCALLAAADVEQHWTSAVDSWLALAPDSRFFGALELAAVAVALARNGVIPRGGGAGGNGELPQRSAHRMVDLWSSGEAILALSESLHEGSIRLSAAEERARVGTLLSSIRLMLLDAGRWTLEQQSSGPCDASCTARVAELLRRLESQCFKGFITAEREFLANLI